MQINIIINYEFWCDSRSIRENSDVYGKEDDEEEPDTRNPLSWQVVLKETKKTKPGNFSTLTARQKVNTQ